MKYYKLLDGNEFIGVITDKDFRKNQKKNNILLVSSSESADYARFKNELYRDRSWMKPVDDNRKFPYKNVDIINITEEEYNTLLGIIETGEKVHVDDTVEDSVVDEVEPEIELDAQGNVTLEFVKRMKISEMRKICNATITGGCDISLSNGNDYHFSMSIEDQINLLNIRSLINLSDDKIIYHADGERCEYFSREDMMMILDKTHRFKTYHTTYFNGLKAYINSLTDITTIAKIEYGVELPGKFTHAFLKNYETTT